MIEHEDVAIFRAQVDRRPQVTANPDEVGAIDWLSKAEILRRMAARPGDFTPWFRIYMADHADGLFPAR